MSTQTKNIDLPAKVWPMFGPLFLGGILLMIIIRPAPTPLWLPVMAIAGIYASHLLKWKGVAFSSLLLVIAMAYSLYQHPFHAWSWLIALGFSIAAAFIMTVLCAEEAERSPNSSAKSEPKAQSPGAIIHLNEKIQGLQELLTAEKKEHSLEISSLKQQLQTKEEKQKSNEELIKRAHQELKSAYQQKQALLDDLSELRKRCQELENGGSSQQIMDSPQAEGSISDSIVEELKLQLDALKDSLMQAEEREKECKKAIEDISQKLKSLEETHFLETAEAQNEIFSHQEASKALSTKLQAELQTSQKLLHHIQELKASQEHLLTAQEQLLTEKQHLLSVIDHEKAKEKTSSEPSEHDFEMMDREIRRIQGLYLQLKEQFVEKSEVLDTTRQQLFFANEKLTAIEKEKAQAAVADPSFGTKEIEMVLKDAALEIVLLEKQYQTEIRQLEEIIDSFSKG